MKSTRQFNPFNFAGQKIFLREDADRTSTRAGRAWIAEIAQSGLYPEDYIQNSSNKLPEVISKIGTISDARCRVDQQKNGASKLHVDFMHDGENFTGDFMVEREPNGTSYTLRAKIRNSKGKEIFGKTKKSITLECIEHAIAYVFHEAFVEE